MSIDTGRLFYVMGPSGVGKDSFIQAVRACWGTRLLVAHRYITRSAAAGGENHIELCETEFQLRKDRGLFALSWAANGHHYGVGREINDWLASGMDVMVNGSRAYLPQARTLFSERLYPVLVQVDAETLGQRLRARGRENEAEICQRLERAAAYQLAPSDDVCWLDNSGNLADTLRQFQRYQQLLPA
ncbi:ribose 1,5-bisphosphokinase [Oceanisphaera sp. IT1-181]|uniref:ribose 1,5-bisphosphokinase n=1 Tax=Oceanisphaera sp. IT1-181 TaxID=3081199 RepID=UPI0029CA2342|nr:ribose 1,5-bisphosphokinase [Oceanisphaera sp. IT1-181]